MIYHAAWIIGDPRGTEHINNFKSYNSKFILFVKLNAEI